MNKFLALSLPTDFDLANALGATRPFKEQWVNREVIKLLEPYESANLRSEYITACVCYYRALTNRYATGALFSTTLQLKNDIERIGVALLRLAKESERWEDTDSIKAIPFRVKFGASWEVARLIAEGATFSQAKRLYAEGITSMTQRSLPQYASIFKAITG